MKNRLLALAAIAWTATSVLADTAVTWTAPPNNSTYDVGTAVVPVGQASASGGTGGSGLDLAIVIDVSGSMSGGGIIAARAAGVALINALPEATTSVTIISFNSSANTVRVLSPLTTDRVALIAAVNGLNAGGGTTIGTGIDAATTELTSSRHTAGRSQQMVVLSDGFSSGNPALAADNAKTAGVDAIHSVGVPGHDVGQMRGIADGLDNIYGNSDDNGVYTSGSLDQLVGLFSGTGGNLVGIDHVDVTLPNGITTTVPTDGLGNFSIPGSWSIQAGPQTFVATAYGTDGTSASSTLTLNGRTTTTVPEAASTLGCLGIAMLSLAGFSRKMRK